MYLSKSNIKVIKLSFNDDPMIKFIRLMHLKKSIMPFEYSTLDLKYLNKLRQEVELLELKMIEESKIKKD